MIKITKDNIEQFAEVMYRFNCAHEYNSLCCSVSDIKRELNAFQITDKILEELDVAGFDMSSIKTFKKYNWKIDNLQSPVIENPIYLLENEAYIKFLSEHKIRI